MNILVVNGSPRKNGNSELLCKEFVRGAREAGNHVDEVYLREKTVMPCRACYACFSTGKCVQKDDMAGILEKTQNADILVWATPTYFLTMSGQLKTMIDRLLPKWSELGGKDAYIIVTGHDGKAGLSRNAEDLRAVLTNLGCRVKSVIWGEHVWKAGEVRGTAAMEEAYNAGLGIRP